MPKIISYTPAWLSSPAPGQDVFSPKPQNCESSSPYKALTQGAKRKARSGPRRVIACRGTEVFVAVGKEIRWVDLTHLKEDFEDDRYYEETSDTESEDKSPRSPRSHRTFKVPVSDDIRQLVMSPNKDYMAVLTKHTVHIAILPDSSHLTAPDTENQSAFRLKTYTLGSVTHVTTQSPVISALWHPLGVNGSCIVTITEDATVRIWELSTFDRWSFDRPTLAIDLQKLADGTALDQDFSASSNGARKGFSPDSFEMEVAAAAFGGRECGGWSSMTLWIAMREGDVYALCPFLPEKWAPPPTLIPSLSVSIVAKVATLEDDAEATQHEKQLAQQQLAWMGDLDNQISTITEIRNGEDLTEVYSRPTKPGRVPKLQGPFDFDFAPEESEFELDQMLSDIYVIGKKIDTEELMFGEENDLEMEDAEGGGLSLDVICLLTSSGRVSICLDLDGVEAQWLPNSKSRLRRFAQMPDSPSLLTFQTMETLKSEEKYEEGWPMFSHDVASRYSFFITHASGVSSISLNPWIFPLENELQNHSITGLEFRIDVLIKGPSSLRQRVITRHLSEGDIPSALSASVVFQDPDLGYFLLSSSPHRAVAVAFEALEDSDAHRSRSSTMEPDQRLQPLLLCAPREIYQIPSRFTSQSQIPRLLDDLRRSKYRRAMHESVRLSPAILTIMTSAHKVLSDETHRLGVSAAELFRQCERLQIEMRDQIQRANEVAGRVEAVVGGNVNHDVSTDHDKDELESRIMLANDRQRDLTERLEKLRKKAAMGGQRKSLSDKEKMWIDEVSTLEDKFLPESNDKFAVTTVSAKPWTRLAEVTALARELLGQVSAVGEADSDNIEEERAVINVSSEIRRQKVAQVMKLLEREQALVDGTKNRLERLTIA